MEQQTLIQTILSQLPSELEGQLRGFEFQHFNKISCPIIYHALALTFHNITARKANLGKLPANFNEQLTNYLHLHNLLAPQPKNYEELVTKVKDLGNKLESFYNRKFPQESFTF